MESVWFGVIEDVLDPMQLSRVRVRIFNEHNPSLVEVPTSSLPWATVMGPTTSAHVSGVGQTPHNLVPGSHVVGVFLDGSDKQIPMVIGSIAGMPMSAPNSAIGFNDPKGLYPSEDYLKRSDVNKLATTIGTPSPVKAKLSSRVVPTTTATGKIWIEPTNIKPSIYPRNHVQQSTSGHFSEIDDTPGNERITEYHKTLTSREIFADGSKVEHTTGSDYTIIDKDGKVRVKGNLDITVDKSATLKLSNGVDIFIGGSGAHIKIVGPVTLDVTGNILGKVTGNINWNVSGNVAYQVGGSFSVIAGTTISVTAPAVNWQVNGSMTQNITGSYSLNTGGPVNMTAPTYNFN